MSTLTTLGPIDQLRAGRLGRRIPQLVIGLVLYGLSMALMIRSGLGQMPWDVLHFGLAQHLPLSFGQVVIATSVLVLLAWFPLRQAPGLGTVLNAVVIGLTVDAALAVLGPAESLPMRAAALAGGVALNAFATACYIGAQLGPGPRDGLMTGWVRRSGRSVRRVRTVLEAAVVLAGWLLGGVVGVGTVLYAIAIGPLTQLMLPALTVSLAPAAPRAEAAARCPR